MKLLIAGDFCDSHRVSKYIEEKNFSPVINDCRKVIVNSDIRIVNFEFPIVDEHFPAMPISKAGPLLKGNRNSVDFLKYAGFNVCTLANNHILDQGEKCCLNTKHLLESSGISTVGVGENLEDANKILYIKHNQETLAIINCCEHEFSVATHKTAGANPLNPIQQYYKIQEAKKNADFVLVIVHGGHEYCQLPSPRMKELYRFFIEVGADAAVNHHQHCFSGFEVYKGKPIFYGLGNFIFDKIGRINSSWNEGFLLELVFDKKDRPAYNLIPYSQCNDSPTVSLMRDDDLLNFKQRLIELNTIISDDELLLKEWKRWILDNSSYFLMDFEPYHSRIAKAFYKRGLLPSFMNKAKKMGIINHLECESHLDRLRLMINSIV